VKVAHDERGFALLMALWAIALIAGAMAFGVAQTSSRSDEFKLQAELAAARMALRAGFALAYSRLGDPGADPPVGGFKAKWIGYDVTIRIEDEAGKVNPNFAPPSLMSALFAELGASPQSADQMAQRFADFVDRDDLTAGGTAEAAEYRRARRPPPRNAALRHSNELWAVLGFDALTDSLRPNVDILQLLTVHTRRDEINLAASAAPVVAAYAKAAIDADGRGAAASGVFKVVVEAAKAGGPQMAASKTVALSGPRNIRLLEWTR